MKERALFCKKGLESTMSKDCNKGLHITGVMAKEKSH